MGIVRSLKKIFKNSKNSEKNQRLSDIENAKFENEYSRKKAKAVSRQKVQNALPTHFVSTFNFFM